MVLTQEMSLELSNYQISKFQRIFLKFTIFSMKYILEKIVKADKMKENRGVGFILLIMASKKDKKLLFMLKISKCWRN